MSRKDEDTNIDVLLDELMCGIKKENRKVLITVDEVMDNKYIRNLIQSFNAYKRKNIQFIY